MRADREAGTPGPWILRENKHQFSLYTKEGPDHSGYGRRIADVIYWGADHTGPKENPLYSAASSNARRIARVPDMEDMILAQAEENERLRAALIWCSGSADFQTDGRAREGWLKLCKPILTATWEERE